MTGVTRHRDIEGRSVPLAAVNHRVGCEQRSAKITRLGGRVARYHGRLRRELRRALAQAHEPRPRASSKITGRSDDRNNWAAGRLAEILGHGGSNCGEGVFTVSKIRRISISIEKISGAFERPRARMAGSSIGNSPFDGRRYSALAKIIRCRNVRLSDCRVTPALPFPATPTGL